MRRLFLTVAVSAAVLIAGALVPERGGVPTPAAPIAVPVNINLV